MRLSVHTAVDTEVRHTADWDDAQRGGLGEEFVAEVDETLARIETSPHTQIRYRNDVWFARMRRFPYLVSSGFLMNRFEFLRSGTNVAIQNTASIVSEVAA